MYGVFSSVAEGIRGAAKVCLRLKPLLDAFRCSPKSYSFKNNSFIIIKYSPVLEGVTLIPVNVTYMRYFEDRSEIKHAGYGLCVPPTIR